MFEEDLQKSSLDSILQKRRGTKPTKSRNTEIPAKKTVIEETLLNEDQTPPTFDLPKSESQNNPVYKKKSFWWERSAWWSLASILIIAIVIWGGFWLVSLGQRIFQGSSPLSFFSSFGSFIGSDDTPLTGEQEGEINILLLGIGGAGHEGGTLADTIIIASIRPEINKDDLSEISNLYEQFRRSSQEFNYSL